MPLQTPQITIISALHNPGPAIHGFLTRLARTIYHQSQVVIVDDASSDGSSAIVKEWASTRPNVHLIVNPDNLGVAASRNMALTMASGTYVWFVDHDDLWETEILRKLYSGTQDGADIVVCRADMRFDSANAVRIVDGLAETSEVSSSVFTELMLRGKIHGFLWNKLFRRSLFSESPFPILSTQSDFCGVLAATGHANKVQFIPDVLYHYMVRAGSLTRVRSPSLTNLVHAHAVMLQHAGSLGIPVTRPDLISQFSGWFLGWAAITLPARWRADAVTQLEGAELARNSLRSLPIRDLLQQSPPIAALLIANRVSPKLSLTMAKVGYAVLDASRSLQLGKSRPIKSDHLRPPSKVVYLRVDDVDYPRNRRVRAYLAANQAYDVVVVKRSRRGSIVRRSAVDIARAIRVTRGASVLIVAEFSLAQVPVFWLIARLRSALLVVDGFVGKYETEVGDWATSTPNSLRGIWCRMVDRLALFLADVYLIDTEVRADNLRSSSWNGRVLALPVGAPPWAQPQNGRDSDGVLRILYYGNFLPLHGLPTVLEAVAMVETNIQITLVGDDHQGHMQALAVQLGVDRLCTFLDPVPENELLGLIHAHDVILGIFGTSEKASSVIANKVWQGLASGRSVLTRKSPALIEISAIVGDQLVQVDPYPEPIAASFREYSLRQAHGSWATANIDLEEYVAQRFVELDVALGRRARDSD